MAIITLKKPGSATGNHYLNLTTGSAGFADPDDNALPSDTKRDMLSTGSIPKLAAIWDTSCVGLPSDQVQVKARQKFDQIEYQKPGVFGPKSVSSQTFKRLDETLPPGSLMLLKTRGEPRRYFKVLVEKSEGGDAFEGDSVNLLFEELVKYEKIVPLNIVFQDLRHKQPGIKVTNEQEVFQHTHIKKNVKRVKWSVRPALEEGNLPKTFHDVMYPVAKIEFQKDDSIYRRRPPAWVGMNEARTLASSSYMNSTLTITVNDAGRPPEGEPSESYYYTAYLIGGVAVQVVPWDPEVMVDPH